jgi:DNA repair exonuclease SbcCD nuclease subunit
VRPGIIVPHCVILVACLPHLPSQELKDVDQVLAGFERRIREHRGPSLLAAHVTLEGAQLSNGETMAHQGSSFSPARLLGLGVDVVASGHIHLPQSMCDGRAWHVGSIRRTDFGERNDQKGWLLVEWGSGLAPRIEFRPIAQRDMVKLEGLLTEDGWAHSEGQRPFPGPWEWPAISPDA